MAFIFMAFSQYLSLCDFCSVCLKSLSKLSCSFLLQPFLSFFFLLQLCFLLLFSVMLSTFFIYFQNPLLSSASMPLNSVSSCVSLQGTNFPIPNGYAISLSCSTPLSIPQLNISSCLITAHKWAKPYASVTMFLPLTCRCKSKLHVLLCCPWWLWHTGLSNHEQRNVQLRRHLMHHGGFARPRRAEEHHSTPPAEERRAWKGIINEALKVKICHHPKLVFVASLSA